MMEILMLALGFVAGAGCGVGVTFLLIALDKNVVVMKPGETPETKQAGVRKRGTTGEARSIYANGQPEEFWDDETS